MERTKPEIIRSVPEGSTLLVGLSKGDSIDAWRVRASEINAADGWRHNTIGLNKYSGQVAITAHHRDEELTAEQSRPNTVISDGCYVDEEVATIK